MFIIFFNFLDASVDALIPDFTLIASILSDFFAVGLFSIVDVFFLKSAACCGFVVAGTYFVFEYFLTAYPEFNVGVFFYDTFYWNVLFFLSLSSPNGVNSFPTFYKFFYKSSYFYYNIFNLSKLMVALPKILPLLPLGPPAESSLNKLGFFYLFF